MVTKYQKEKTMLRTSHVNAKIAVQKNRRRRALERKRTAKPEEVCTFFGKVYGEIDHRVLTVSVFQMQLAMDSSKPSPSAASRDATPNPTVSSRFTSQNATAEELLKAQTVGLVNLSDFRKRRAEALEVKEREGYGEGSGGATPVSGASTPADR